MDRSARSNVKFRNVPAQLAISASVLLLPPIAVSAVVVAMLPAGNDSSARDSTHIAASAPADNPTALSSTVSLAPPSRAASAPGSASHAAQASRGKDESRAKNEARAKDDTRPTEEMPVKEQMRLKEQTRAKEQARPADDAAAKDETGAMGPTPVRVTVLQGRRPENGGAPAAIPPEKGAAAPLVVEASTDAPPSPGAVAAPGVIAPPSIAAPAVVAAAQPAVSDEGASPAEDGARKRLALAGESPTETTHAIPARHYYRFYHIRRLAHRHYWRHDTHSERWSTGSQDSNPLQSLIQRLSTPARN